MEVVLGILMIYTGLCYGQENTSCDATQDGAQCYGALGGTVHIQLFIDNSARECRLLQNPYGKRTVILKIKKEDVFTAGPRFKFYYDSGTLKITDMEGEDFAEYLLEINKLDTGITLGSRRLQLFIKVSVLAVLGSIAAVALVVVAALVGGYCFLRRKRPPQTPDTAESPELHYAVTALKKGGPRREEKREVEYGQNPVKEEKREVEYGEITVLEGPRKKREREGQEKQEETIYAGIQQGQ